MMHVFISVKKFFHQKEYILQNKLQFNYTSFYYDKDNYTGILNKSKGNINKKFKNVKNIGLLAIL
ncbi:hypothetical protein TP70_08320 [Staphylococcus microti]|uniref:Uncharacterized protein n=1 Tax=Staphylococcus microti TaxID=569857 RepID=A0ABR5C6J7_9STAP|nr:hypothetical protein TP70_08320 [Staphylococcus microti]PNZ80376.1 hypothetical protein CD132_08060 [Staphylococcus microti]